MSSVVSGSDFLLPRQRNTDLRFIIWSGALFVLFGSALVLEASEAYSGSFWLPASLIGSKVSFD